MTTQNMRAIASQLKRLAPHQAATYSAQSIVNWTARNYSDAIRCSVEASRADPKYELGHTFYGWLLCCFGWPEQARKETEIALALAPSKTIVYRAMGNSEMAARHYGDAIKWYEKAIKLETNHYLPYNGIGRALQAMGDYTNALLNLEKSETPGRRRQC